MLLHCGLFLERVLRRHKDKGVHELYRQKMGLLVSQDRS